MLHPRIFKANDIRGIVTGEQVEWDIDGARRLGAAFVELLDLDGRQFVMGRDMRQLGREFSLAFSDGARGAGAHVIDVGLTSTDQLWFASGDLGLPGVQFTASHNPAQYNGIKFCLAHARPVPGDFTARIRDLADVVEIHEPRGTYSTRDVLHDYAEKLHELVPDRGNRELRVVVDAGNGMAGHICLPVLAGRGLDVIGLFLELDGTFPNHPANPLEPENLVAAQAAVRQNQADLGLVFDGDADRCFIIDETGSVVDPSVITAMIALAELEKHPGGVIVINSITSRCVEETVAGRGELVVSRVGHTYVKAAMAEHDAIFGGEHSAHYYFRDFWSADTGMLAALHVIEMLRRSKQSLSGLTMAFDDYHRSGEINSVVDSAENCLAAVQATFEDRGTVHHDDGLTISHEDWWLNLRASNTEPLLRLNIEARQPERVTELRDEVLALINATSPPNLSPKE